MNIFLTSQASNVLEKISSLLPKQPTEYKVAFVPTGAKPYTDAPWMHTDRDELVRLGFSVENLELDVASFDQVETVIASADIIFVAGGNTFYLLEQAKKSGFDGVAKEAVQNGKIYIGSSAGSVLAAPDISYVTLFDDPKEANLENTQGLGLVDFAVLPHAGNPKYKELHERVLEEYKDSSYKIVLITDTQFAVQQDGTYDIVTV